MCCGDSTCECIILSKYILCSYICCIIYMHMHTLMNEHTSTFVYSYYKEKDLTCWQLPSSVSRPSIRIINVFMQHATTDADNVFGMKVFTENSILIKCYSVAPLGLVRLVFFSEGKLCPAAADCTLYGTYYETIWYRVVIPFV